MCGYLVHNTIDLDNPKRLGANLLNYCPHASIPFANGLLVTLRDTGLLQFGAKTFHIKYSGHYAATICSGLCTQAPQHSDLFNMFRMNMVPGIYDTRTYDELGGAKLKYEGTFKNMSPPPLDLAKGVDWELIVNSHRKALAVFLYFLVEVFKFELFLRTHGKHPRLFVQNEFFPELLAHPRLHVFHVMHPSALCHHPCEKQINHLVEVEVKYYRFLQRKDFKDKELVGRLYTQIRPYFPAKSNVSLECIKMKDMNSNAYEDGATFQLFHTYDELSTFLKKPSQNLWGAVNRYNNKRGVIILEDGIFFVRKQGSLEAFPRISERIVQLKVHVCEVKLINTNRIGTLEKVGQITDYDYMSDAARRVVALSRKSPKPKLSTVKTALSKRWNEKQKGKYSHLCKMPYTVGDQKVMIGKSVQQLKYDIAAYKVNLTANGCIPRGRYMKK